MGMRRSRGQGIATISAKAVSYNDIVAALRERGETGLAEAGYNRRPFRSDAEKKLRNPPTLMNYSSSKKVIGSPTTLW